MTDCAAILETIAAHDEKDSTSMGRDSYDFTSALVEDVKGMKIGIPRDYFGEGLDPEVKEAILKAVKVLEEKGAVVEEFDLQPGRICDSSVLCHRVGRGKFQPVPF